MSSSKDLFIVAEAAANTFGSAYLLEKTIEAAANSGANAIKFQHIYPEEVYAPGDYEYGKYDINAVRKLREQSAYRREDLELAIKIGDSLGIEVFWTPFGLRALEDLIKLDIKTIKIASGDNDYSDLILAALQTGKKCIFSTGMSNLDDILELNRMISDCGAIDRSIILHCVAEYPHNVNKSQLGAIRYLMDTVSSEVGYSDHTTGVESAISAVTLGVRVIEKHFTLSKNLGGLDARHSVEPNDFKDFVSTLRSIRCSLDFREKLFDEDEQYTAKRARRGLYAARDIKAGEIITKQDVAFLRPQTKLSPLDLKFLIGKKLQTDIEKGKPFQVGMI